MQTNGNASVYLLPLPGAHLLYAPLHDLSALVNETAMERIHGSAHRKDSQKVRDIRKTLAASPGEIPVERTGPFLPDFIGLIPTRSCNLDCSYCGFRRGGGPSRVMTPELAVAALEWYARRMKRAGRDTLNIHFFGGEPFIQPALCMMAVHAGRILAAKHGMRAVFEAATNGYMTEETARFVSDAIDCIVLSLDGPPEIQNRHRPRPDGEPSYETVIRNARIFSEGTANLCVRACITADTVHHMEELASWFNKELRPDSVSFETLQESDESREAGLQIPDPWDFAMNFARAEAVLDRFGVKTIYATADITAQTVSFCPVGRDVAIVSPDGQIAGCYLLEKDWRAQRLDLRLGKITESGKVRIEKASVQRLRRLNVTRMSRCERCFCKWHCAGGCHVNHSFPGCTEGYDSLCIQTRLIALFRILKSLKREDVLHTLMRDREALEHTILQPSDRLSSQSGEAHA